MLNLWLLNKILHVMFLTGSEHTTVLKYARVLNILEF